MKRITMWRPLMIGAITLLCIGLFWDSARYFLILRDPDADPEKVEALRQKAIPLGLDLRGGVDVTLMIDGDKIAADAISDRVTTLRNDLAESKFSAAVGPTEDGKNFTVRVLDPADARNVANLLSKYEDITGDTDQSAFESGAEVVLGLRKDSLNQSVGGAIEGALKVVRERMDKLGLSQPSISREGPDRIRVQVPGEKDPARVIDNLTRLASMEFRLTHDKFQEFDDPVNGLLDENGELAPGAIIPLGYELVPYRFGHLDRATQEIIYTEGKMLVEREIRLRGDNLRSAGVIQNMLDVDNPIQVQILLDNHGTEVFANLTRDSVENVRKGGKGYRLAILLDGECISAPTLQVVITGGSAVITGGFRYEEALDLANALKAGSLPAPLIAESKRTVDASLGGESIGAGVSALGVGTLLVMVFMAFYYGMAGVISIFALVLNVLIILAILSLANATLTLSGIGGILLTVGMAVDANVLIYERIREEVDAGRPLRQAITIGFGRAFTVILDSNITTLMTALVLLQFTEGSVFGFALTMTFGLIANLFTGLTVTYTLCALWFQWRNTLSLGKLRFFLAPTYDFIKMRKISGMVSIGVIGASLLIVLLTGGLRMGVDFSGGLLSEVRFTKAVGESEIREAVRLAGLDGERVQAISGTEDYIIRVRELAPTTPEEEATGALMLTEQRLREGLNQAFGADRYKILLVNSFGPETGQGFRKMALSVVLLASLAILFYLWMRFELVFGVAAVIALLHDLTITILLATLWNVEITLDAVAALMVMLGFSVNDTIVIFDRIRENTRRMTNLSFGEICNVSMNQSLSRTVITTGTVMITVLVMLMIGGEGLKPFAKILLLGSIVGTYSSCFIAAPVVYHWNESQKNRVQKALAAKKTSGPVEAPEQQKRGTPRKKGSGGSGRVPRVKKV